MPANSSVKYRVKQQASRSPYASWEDVRPETILGILELSLHLCKLLRWQRVQSSIQGVLFYFPSLRTF